MGAPPTAVKRPYVRRVHGTETSDPWFWLSQRDDPAVLAYLHAENAYTENATAHLGGLRASLFAELRERISETYDSLAVPKGAWEYFTRTVEGLAYPIHLRRPRWESATGGQSGHETVLLDENQLARSHAYFAVGDLTVSPDHRLLAYTADTTGEESFELFVTDIETGTLLARTGLAEAGLAQTGGDLSYGLEWGNDNLTLFATSVDQARRAYRVVRHTLEAPTATDSSAIASTVVFEEPDERFWVSISKTRSERFVVITSESETTSECYLIDLDTDDSTGSALELVRPREPGVEYRVDHQGDRLLIVTNQGGAENFRLVQAPLPASSSSGAVKLNPDWQPDWQEVIPHQPDTRLEGVDCFANFAVLLERSNAATRLRLLNPADNSVQLLVPTTSKLPPNQLPNSQEPFEVSTTANAEYNTTHYRYALTSLVTPPSVFEFDVATLLDDSRGQPPGNPAPNLLRVAPVANGVDLSAYKTERLWALNQQTRVPLSLVWRPDAVTRPAPCLLYGYGAYEISIPASFSSAVISLLDRGVVFAIAHIRGGGEMGRSWYLEGRLEHKQNTFDDFTACARHLVDQGWTQPDRLVARGASAGGLLMGATVNQAPELFAGVVAEVPFVDTLNTMLDPAVPLTVTEYDEWGDPSQLDSFEVIRAYAPYENVPAHPSASRPALLVTAGLNDPRVQYWEPAKWVAKLRANSSPADTLPTNQQAAEPTAPILLRTQMSAGHGGPTGRYEAWRYEAFVQAFVLDVMGLASHASAGALKPQR